VERSEKAKAFLTPINGVRNHRFILHNLPIPRKPSAHPLQDKVSVKVDIQAD